MNSLILNRLITLSSREVACMIKSPFARLTNYSNESQVAIFTKKMQENKQKNILIYSRPTDGSIFINSIGLIGCLVFIGFGYNCFYIFATVRGQDSENPKPGIFNSVLRTIKSDYFRYVSCGGVAFVGVAMFVSSLLITSRQVNKMYLLKGGHTLGRRTHNSYTQ